MIELFLIVAVAAIYLWGGPSARWSQQAGSVQALREHSAVGGVDHDGWSPHEGGPW